MSQEETASPQVELEEFEIAPELAELEALRVERDELRDKFMRVLADAENARKRAERDRKEAEMYGSTRLARDLFVAAHPEIECDGELHGDAALEPNIRNAYMADSTLTDSANLLICPNLDAANILYNVLKTTTSGGVTVGPILMGAAATAYILTPAATVRRVLNMTALAVASAAARPK